VSHANGTFRHCACLYEDDEQFLAAAVPFLTEGLESGQRSLAVTTPHQRALLGAALGARSESVDYADSASFGGVPPRYLAACHRYWKGGAGVRILAGPLWAGRSAREITAWTLMEAALNVTLASTSISMMCSYDAAALGQDIIVNALRTHPERAAGAARSPSAGYSDPAEFARSFGAAPLPDPPATAEAFEFDGDLRELRRFIAGSAVARGMAGGGAQMLVLAASEIGAYLKNRWPASTAVRVWEQQAAAVCDFRQPGGSVTDPFLALRPAGLVPGDGDGLWLANQICDWMEIRPAATGGCAIQMQVPGSQETTGAHPGSPRISDSG
jgi:hypothetical protein